MPRKRQRRGTVIVSTVVVASAVAAFTWFVWLPRHRPSLGAGESYGIDISHHQGAIDWRRVADDDIEFAYIKATEGGDFVDDRFAENWSGSADAGLLRGAYHFFTLCTAGSVQARHFLDVVPPDPDALPPAVDLELAQNCSARPPTEDVKRELTAFLQTVEAATDRAMLIYVGDDFEDHYMIRDAVDRAWWLPRLLLRPSGDWALWQASAFATIEGVDGRVDLDVAADGWPWRISSG